MKNNTSREQAIDYIVKEFNLLPYQEYILRKIWESKSYLLTPVRSRGWSYTRGLLTMIDVVLRKDK